MYDKLIIDAGERKCMKQETIVSLSTISASGTESTPQLTNSMQFLGIIFHGRKSNPSTQFFGVNL